VCHGNRRMSAENAVQKIACRFNTELLEIQKYIGFIRSKSTVDLRHVFELNKVLRQNLLPELPVRSYLGMDHRLTADEVQQLVPAIFRIIPAIDRRMSDLIRQVDSNSPFLQGADLDQSVLGEWIRYFMDRMAGANLTPEDIEHLRRAAMQEAKRDGDQEMAEQERTTYIGSAIRYSMHYVLSSQLGALQDVLDRFEEMKIIAAATNNNAVTDIIRQGFIVLMAAFDAAVFDLVRFALRKKFFTLAAAFGNKDKFSISELAEFGSFERFRDEIIETQLTRRYIKGVLRLLSESWNVECVNRADGTQFGRLIEIVLRRNVHLHNRGLIDEFYLNQNYNLDGFKLGDAARIDEQYWQLAKDHCTYCVRQVAIWAES
jgi:hypothetical protein